MLVRGLHAWFLTGAPRGHPRRAAPVEPGRDGDPGGRGYGSRFSGGCIHGLPGVTWNSYPGAIHGSPPRRGGVAFAACCGHDSRRGFGGPRQRPRPANPRDPRREPRRSWDGLGGGRGEGGPRHRGRARAYRKEVFSESLRNVAAWPGRTRLLGGATPSLGSADARERTPAHSVVGARTRSRGGRGRVRGMRGRPGPRRCVPDARGTHELSRDQLPRRRRGLPRARGGPLADHPLHHVRLHHRGTDSAPGRGGRRPGREPGLGPGFGQDGRVSAGQHPRRRGVREGGAPDAAPRPGGGPSRGMARVDDPARRAHLQRRRQRAGDPHQPGAPVRPHRGGWGSGPTPRATT